MEAGKYTEHKMYRKLTIKTSIGKLKILPMNGGKFYSKHFVGEGVEYPLPTDVNPHTVELNSWEEAYTAMRRVGSTSHCVPPLRLDLRPRKCQD